MQLRICLLSEEKALQAKEQGIQEGMFINGRSSKTLALESGKREAGEENSRIPL